MNRSDLLSLGDPIPTSLGKALTPEQLAEKKAAAAAALQNADYSALERRVSAAIAETGPYMRAMTEQVRTGLGAIYEGHVLSAKDVYASAGHFFAKPKLYKRYRPMVEDPPSWAVEKAAQAWCDPSVSDRVMDVDLALVFARMLAEAVQDAHNLAMRPQIMVNPAQLSPEAIDDMIRKANRNTWASKPAELVVDPAAPVALHE